MNHEQTRLRILALVSTAVLATFALTARAQEAPPPAPGVMESFSCTYKSGKDRDDLMSARDYYVRQAGKAGIKLANAYLWEPFKTDAPVNFLWLTFHDNLTAFGAATEAEMASSDMASVSARFNAVADCSSGLAAVRAIREGESAAAKPPALISTRACNSRGSMSDGDIEDMRNHISGVMDSLESFRNVSIYSAQPMTSGPNTPDVYLFSVHDGVGGWAARTSEVSASPQGQSLRRHFERKLDCTQALWLGEQVVGGS